MNDVVPIPMTVHYLLSIHGPDGNQLVGIKPDGTVMVRDHGADAEAAKIFWKGIQSHGQSLVSLLNEYWAALPDRDLVTELPAWLRSE